MRTAEPMQRFRQHLPQWFTPPGSRTEALASPAASEALAALERSTARATATLQQAARSATSTLRRSMGMERAAKVGAGVAALRLARAHPALTAGLALGAVGIGVLMWRRRHARQQEAQESEPLIAYESEYL